MAPTRLDIGDLQLGVATAALQIEGGDRNNNWYDWAHLPGTIADASTPLRATDHWNRWQDDTALMSELGIQTYRMSVEWARIEPEVGRFDDAVLQRYRDELAAVVAAGIRPLVTLHHFTNPRWLQRMGEWANPRAVDLFCRFAGVVVDALGDLVSDWCTINEPNVYATQAHLFNEAPPGRASWRNVRDVLRHMGLAHCRAYRLIHEAQPEARVGFAHHMRVFAPLSARNPVQRVLAGVEQYLFQDAIAHAMLGGRFSKFLGRADGIEPGRYYDYLGLNYYSRTAVSRFAADGTMPGSPVNDLGWEIYPDGIAECARWLHERYPAPIWITENGTCDNGSATSPDRFRSRYIADHLAALIGSGLPVERYYHWCFVDNWEWSEGEVPRFGLVALDYETQERTVKPSGHFYADIIANRGITEDAWQRWVEAERYDMGNPRLP